MIESKFFLLLLLVNSIIRLTTSIEQIGGISPYQYHHHVRRTVSNTTSSSTNGAAATTTTTTSPAGGGKGTNTTTTSTTPKAINLTILHINDHHSKMDEFSFFLFNTTLPPGLDPSIRKLQAYYGGPARISKLLQIKKQEAINAQHDVLRFHGGDAITGSLFYTLFGPEVDATILNVMGFDAFTLGNHEFDDGDSNAAALISILNMSTTSCNLQPHNGSDLLQLGEKSVKPYLVFKLPLSGENVGLCGITPKGPTMLASVPDKGTTIGLETDAANACVTKLKDLGVNKIILLSHNGYDFDKNVLSGIDGVDVIVGAHSHSLLGNKESFSQFGFVPKGPYAKMVNKTCIVQSWAYFQCIGNLEVEFDVNGNVVSCGGSSLIPLNTTTFTVMNGTSKAVGNLNESSSLLVAQYLLNHPSRIFVDYGIDQNIVDTLTPYRAKIQTFSMRPIAQVNETLCNTRGGQDSACADHPAMNYVGGAACLMAPTAFLFNVKTADIAIQNRGSCRSSLMEGQLTYGDAFSFLPYSNVLVSFNLTGGQIHRLLEEGFNYFLAKLGPSSSYPNGAGVRWEVDYTMPYLSRVSNIEINRRLTSSWEPLDRNAYYWLTTTDFLAAQKDGYFTFGEINQNDPNYFVNHYIEYAQSFIDFASEQKVLTTPPLSQWSTQYLKSLDGTIVDFRNGTESFESINTTVLPTPTPTPASTPISPSSVSTSAAPTSVSTRTVTSPVSSPSTQTSPSTPSSKPTSNSISVSTHWGVCISVVFTATLMMSQLIL